MQNGHRRFCSLVFSPLPSFYTLYCIIVFPAVQAVRILVQGFPVERTPSAKAYGFDSSPKGTPFGNAGKLAAVTEAVPLGKVDANAVSRRKG